MIPRCFTRRVVLSLLVGIVLVTVLCYYRNLPRYRRASHENQRTKHVDEVCIVQRRPLTVAEKVQFQDFVRAVDQSDGRHEDALAVARLIVSVNMSRNELADLLGWLPEERDARWTSRTTCCFYYRRDSPVDLQLDEAGRIVQVSVVAGTIRGAVKEPDGRIRVLKPLGYGPPFPGELPVPKR